MIECPLTTTIETISADIESPKSGRSENDNVAVVEMVAKNVSMPTRYEQLRQCICRLAASPKEQAAYLDSIFAGMPGGRDASAYGNDELALELEDIFGTANDMIEHGELSQSEMLAIQPLDRLLKKWSGQENADFWSRPALVRDTRWHEVRKVATAALSQLPDEQRPTGRSS